MLLARSQSICFNKAMLTQTDTQLMERVMRRVVNEVVNEVVDKVVDKKLEEKLKPFHDFAEGTTVTLGNILDELQKIHGQKPDIRVKKLESLHPDNRHVVLIA